MEDRIEDKLIELIDRLVDEKISVNPEFLRFTFYEVRVKNSVTSEEEKAFLTLAQIKLNNMGYVVYLENQEFVYNNSNMRVQPNELIIAIKEKSQSKIDELNSQLQELYAKIMKNENMAHYNQAKQAMDQLVNRINSILVLCINGEDPQKCEPSECSGSCQSCAGCH